MARTEKKTRIKGLPPRVLLSERDAVTGSYPLVIHGELTGLPGLAPFFDTNTLILTQSSNIYYGLGVPTSSIYIPSLLNLTTSLTGPGRVAAGIADTFLVIPKYQGSSSLVPFRDNDQFAADGKSQNASFFATGTNREGLTAPVWSKNKIEIPLSVAVTSSIKVRRDVNYDSYQMGYFNFASQSWEGIGVGVDSKTISDQPNGPGFTGLTFVYSHSCAGFATSLLTPRDSATHIRAMGEVIQDFGFPFSSKYHATASQLFSMRRVINRPFLVEKMVLMVSVSFTGSAPSFSESISRDLAFENKTNLFPIASNTFFVLNQRSRVVFDKPFGAGSDSTARIIAHSPTSSQLSKNGPTIEVETARDVIGYGNIVSYASSIENYSASANIGGDPQVSFENTNIFDDLALKEHLISTNVSGAAGVFWGNPRKLTVSFSANMPLESFREFSGITYTGLSDYGLFLFEDTSLSQVALSNDARDFFSLGGSLTRDFQGGGRNGFGADYLDNRSLSVTPPKSTRLGEFATDYYFGGGRLVRQDRYKTENPYLLFPEDNIVVGWQLPSLWPVFVASVSSSNTLSVTFYPGDAKLVLYGSYLSGDTGVNDTLGQVLASNSIHEAIE